MTKLGTAAIFLLIAAAVHAQFGFGAPGRGQGEAVRVVETEQRVFTTTVSGRLEPANRVAHNATVAGIIAAVRVDLGDVVQAGDVLFTIRRDSSAGSYAPVSVVARIDGVVSDIGVRRDNEVRSGEAGVTLAVVDEYVMTAFISDRDAFSISVGGPVAGRTRDGDEVSGALVARSPLPDFQTGLFTLRFTFRGSGTANPGQYVTVELPVDTVTGVFVPQDALLRRYGSYYVWTVDEANTLRSREVTIGRSHGTDAQVTSGLEPGDRIWVQRRGNEREGMQVPGTER